MTSTATSATSSDLIALDCGMSLLLVGPVAALEVNCVRGSAIGAESELAAELVSQTVNQP